MSKSVKKTLRPIGLFSGKAAEKNIDKAAKFVGLAGDEPKDIPPPATVEDEAVQKMLEEERKRMRKRRGFRSTILTPAEGLSDGGNLQRKTLLGN